MTCRNGRILHDDNLNRLVSYERGVLSTSGNNGSSLDTVTTNTASGETPLPVRL